MSPVLNWRIHRSLLRGLHGWMLRGRDVPDLEARVGLSAVYLTKLWFEEHVDALEMQRYLRAGATVADAFRTMYARHDAAGMPRRRD